MKLYNWMFFWRQQNGWRGFLSIGWSDGIFSTFQSERWKENVEDTVTESVEWTPLSFPWLTNVTVCMTMKLQRPQFGGFWKLYHGGLLEYSNKMEDQTKRCCHYNWMFFWMKCLSFWREERYENHHARNLAQKMEMCLSAEPGSFIDVAKHTSV